QYDRVLSIEMGASINLNGLPTTLRRDFKTLEPASRSVELVGALRAQYVGPAPIRFFAPAFMRVLRFGGWYGKRFRLGAQSELVGINRFRDGTESNDSVPMRAVIGPSVTDNRPAFVVTYPAGTRFPWGYARDEIRALDEQRFLGITVFTLPIVRHFPLAFLLIRE
ncbi:MAG: hypothetical protein ACRDKE_07460, partial [Solirubrobacterales bacterium]